MLDMLPIVCVFVMYAHVQGYLSRVSVVSQTRPGANNGSCQEVPQHLISQFTTVANAVMDATHEQADHTFITVSNTGSGGESVVGRVCCLCVAGCRLPMSLMQFV